MFKLLSLVLGFYLLYRLFGNSLHLGAGGDDTSIIDSDTEDVDYEEVGSDD